MFLVRLANLQNPLPLNQHDRLLLHSTWSISESIDNLVSGNHQKSEDGRIPPPTKTKTMARKISRSRPMAVFVLWYFLTPLNSDTTSPLKSRSWTKWYRKLTSPDPTILIFLIILILHFSRGRKPENWPHQECCGSFENFQTITVWLTFCVKNIDGPVKCFRVSYLLNS